MKCCNLTLDMLDVTMFWLLAKTTYKALLRHVTHCTADKSNGIKLPATHFFLLHSHAQKYKVGHQINEEQFPKYTIYTISSFCRNHPSA